MLSYKTFPKVKVRSSHFKLKLLDKPEKYILRSKATDYFCTTSKLFFSDFFLYFDYFSFFFTCGFSLANSVMAKKTSKKVNEIICFNLG